MKSNNDIYEYIRNVHKYDINIPLKPSKNNKTLSILVHPFWWDFYFWNNKFYDQIEINMELNKIQSELLYKNIVNKKLSKDILLVLPWYNNHTDKNWFNVIKNIDYVINIFKKVGYYNIWIILSESWSSGGINDNEINFIKTVNFPEILIAWGYIRRCQTKFLRSISREMPVGMELTIDFENSQIHPEDYLKNKRLVKNITDIYWKEKFYFH